MTSENLLNSNSTFRSRLGNFANHINLTVVGGKDEVSVAVEKAANDQPGPIKHKHIQFLTEFISNSSELDSGSHIEDVMLKFNALTRWSDSTVAACKVLMCINILMNRCYQSLQHHLQTTMLMLREINQHYTGKSSYLERYVKSLHSKVCLIENHPLVSDLLFLHNVISVSQITNFLNRFGSKVELSEVVNVVTLCLSLQNERLAILRTSMETYNAKEVSTFAESHKLIFEDCQSMTYNIACLINYVSNNDKKDRYNVGLLRDQLDTHEHELRRRDWGSDSFNQL